MKYHMCIVYVVHGVLAREFLSHVLAVLYHKPDTSQNSESFTEWSHGPLVFSAR